MVKFSKRHGSRKPKKHFVKHHDDEELYLKKKIRAYK